MDGEGEPEVEAQEMPASAVSAEEGVPPEAAVEPEPASAEPEDDGGMESGFAALELCTTDDTEPAPPEVLEQLGEAAEGLTGDEADQLGQWLSARLAVESIPVQLKTLQLIGLMLDAAASAKNEELLAAFSEHCKDAVTAGVSFDKIDPEHGERPAQLVRKTAHTVLRKLGGDADAAAASGQGDGAEVPRGTVVGLYGDQSADDLFERALQRRRQKAAGPAVAAEGKKPEVKAKFTFASGLKNLANDLVDSTTLSTKSWRWTPPAIGTETAGDEAEVATSASHFISTRHSSDCLIVLFDGEELKQWRHDPNEIEKDYAFALPGGLGLSGMVTVTRLAANKYDYSLDVPGEVMDLAEHWLTATVELDSIFIRKATVENKDSSDAFILYEVTTILRDRPEGPGHVTHKRFSEFDQLHKLVRSSFSAKLNRSKEFVMPTKPKKTLMKRFDEASVQKRRIELETYLQELIRIPAIGSNPDVLRFLNVPIGGSDAVAASAGGTSEERLAEVAAMIEACSTDDTHRSPKETIAGLARLAMSADDAMSQHLCSVLATRLESESIAVKVKALTLLSTLLTRGSASFCSAVVEVCGELVDQCCSFDREDPEHGTKPAELIRNNATSIRTTLRKFAATRREATKATGDGVVEMATTVDAIPAAVLECMAAATEDSEEKASPEAITAISAVLASASGMGLGGAGNTNVDQLQAIGSYLAKRLGSGSGESTAVKLKTLLLLEQLLPSAPAEATSALNTHCRTVAMSCLHWNKIDPKLGDRPAALVRDKSKAVLALLDAAESI